MTRLAEFQDNRWDFPLSNDTQMQALSALESGRILYFPKLSFQLFEHEKEFLSPLFVDPKSKNISFNRHMDLLKCAPCSPEKFASLKRMLQRFSETAETFIHQLLTPYSSALRLGRTSFRPVEITGRISSYRKDDTRLHVDAFPATPNQGHRILRIFSNINPQRARHWRVGETFLEVAKRFLPLVSRPWPGSSALLKLLHITKSKRTEYDHIMLQLHNKMKADLNYQTIASQENIYFGSGTSWIVQTDEVSHAAMSGQHVLEQTFYLPVNAMLNPALSPVRVLEKLTGRILT
ncbi:MAG: hypothetical protein K0R24_2219 [Gammaproteobacteria bacterium]|jgi:hypothetical protein|nr:hypothetical protein [Gammaproteobacteria bacterium]MCE3239238.1 hypothetical protein [Gammaproteobacteria bacterium]